MSTEIKSTAQKPQVFLKNITFNDETQIKLNHNSIVVFVGANNSGKSQILRDIEKIMKLSQVDAGIVIKNVECEYCGAIDEEQFLRESFCIDSDGKYYLPETGEFFSVNDSFFLRELKGQWDNHRLNNGLYTLFLKRLSTEVRLKVSNALTKMDSLHTHPIFKLYKSETLMGKLSGYFRSAFGVDLIVNRNEFERIPLHIGQAPDKKSYTIDRQDEYYKLVNDLPKLDVQGDGMRGFVSILLDTFTSEHTITLIDEPEAFLHPPQARLIGEMLAKNNPNNRQLFIATHSEDFLKGLIDADCEDITIIRIHRENNVNKMSVLLNEEIKSLWSYPILRYTNILSGLFHDKVVVCESDYDCLFYQALINAIYEHRDEIAPDILFTHCGGKSRIKDVTKALCAVNVPVAAICDFDLLNSSHIFKPTIESLGVEWETVMSEGMRIVYDSMNAKSSVGADAWAQIKRIGKAGFSCNEPAAYEKVERLCRSVGLFIVPVGEIECFDKTINKDKKDWVYEVLESRNLALDTKLEEARQFVQAVVDYRLN